MALHEHSTGRSKGILADLASEGSESLVSSHRVGQRRLSSMVNLATGRRARSEGSGVSGPPGNQHFVDKQGYSGGTLGFHMRAQYYRPPGVCRSKRGPSPRQDEGRLNLPNVDKYVDRDSSYV